ncbi:MAG: aminotransferase class V-fold PLP-dependent enzyme [Bacteroidota bacterium]
MISFYPGPSQVYEKVPKWVKTAYDEGILGINHRSAKFEHMVADVYRLLQEKLGVPADYTISFVSSSTECWEIIAQSFVLENTFHLFSGTFGEKWCKTTKPLVAEAAGYQFDFQEGLDLDQIIIPEDVEVICVTHNETSNGTQIRPSLVAGLREKYPDTLIAIDATSSMAGVALNFELADLWFASVQKCFGLPAGMGILICSPAAAARAEELQRRNHYNSWLKLKDNAQKHQTHLTPNVLDIYLLQQSMQDRKPIDKVDEKILSRYQQWSGFISQLPRVDWLVRQEALRSRTVLALTGESSVLSSLHKKAEAAGFTLGKGYGDWKKSTLRIANFPAMKRDAIEALQAALISE